MNEISEKMQRDSRSMRVLTSAALIYMPASLVAVCQVFLSVHTRLVFYLLLCFIGWQTTCNPLHPIITEFLD